MTTSDPRAYAVMLNNGHGAAGLSAASRSTGAQVMLLEIEKLATALDHAASIDEIGNILDRSRAIEALLRRKAAGTAAAQAAGRIVTDATMRLAKLYAEEESAQGRNQHPDSSPDPSPGKVAIARAAKLDGSQLRRLRVVVDAPPEKVAEATTAIESRGDVITPSGLRREISAPRIVGARSQQARVREAEVERLHAEGRNGAEIAEALGIHQTAVSGIKARVGIRTTGKKLAQDIARAVDALEGVSMQVGTLVDRIGEVDPEMTQEEIRTCTLRLTKAMGTLRRLSLGIKCLRK